MPNTWFSFKQFTVQQDQCAMKVCTDACLFGAWIANRFALMPGIQNILDIGTGTGLLSLMVAQKTTGIIDAIEISKDDAEQAENNFASSPWKKRLNLIHADIRQWQPLRKYDLIISNPPFYQTDLASPNHSRNVAMHNGSIGLEEIISKIKNTLDVAGFAAILLPFKRTGEFETTALRQGLHVQEKIFVKQSPSHSFFRTMLLLSFDKPAAEKEEELTIKNENGSYTSEFQNLLQDYYLRLYV